MPLSPEERARLLAEAAKADAAEQAGTYAPVATPEVSQGFGPMVEPSQEIRVSTVDYASPTGGGRFKVSGAGAKAIIIEDMAHKGLALAGEDPTSHELIFTPDAALATEATLRAGYEAYRHEWGSRASKREPGYNGVPYSPATYRKFIEAGLDPWPIIDQPEPLSESEARIRALEADVKRLTALLPNLPR